MNICWIKIKKYPWPSTTGVICLETFKMIKDKKLLLEIIKDMDDVSEERARDAQDKIYAIDIYDNVKLLIKLIKFRKNKVIKFLMYSGRIDTSGIMLFILVVEELLKQNNVNLIKFIVNQLDTKKILELMFICSVINPNSKIFRLLYSKCDGYTEDLFYHSGDKKFIGNVEYVRGQKNITVKNNSDVNSILIKKGTISSFTKKQALKYRLIEYIIKRITTKNMTKLISYSLYC